MKVHLNPKVGESVHHVTNSHYYLDEELEPRCARPLKKAIVSPSIGTKIDAPPYIPSPQQGLSTL